MEDASLQAVDHRRDGLDIAAVKEQRSTLEWHEDLLKKSGARRV